MHSRFAPMGAAACAAALAALLSAGCSVNPATGKQQLNLVSESQEIQMGQEADKQVVAEMGLYDDPEAQQYVARLGKELAAHSERPNLPWSFKVVDDPAVNAFALPGGFIYVTRGLMTHLNNEAQLVSVLGHEIGHVTARHSVNQISKAQLANIGLIAGAIWRPDLAQGPLGQAAGLGMNMAFLKFGRDDERQADELGMRYLRGENYDPREMAAVFRTLERVGEEAGPGAKSPNWMSTHPAPAERAQTVQKALTGVNTAGLKVNEEPYLQVIDGMVFGSDPREGFFKDGKFFHPEMKFQFQFPQGWKTQNAKSAVAAMSPDKDAIVQITLAQGSDPKAAAQKFFSQQGLQAGEGWTNRIGGKPAVTRHLRRHDRAGGPARRGRLHRARGQGVRDPGLHAGCALEQVRRRAARHAGHLRRRERPRGPQRAAAPRGRGARPAQHGPRHLRAHLPLARRHAEAGAHQRPGAQLQHQERRPGQARGGRPAHRRELGPRRSSSQAASPRDARGSPGLACRTERNRGAARSGSA